MLRIGTGYLGSDSVKTSITNQEIVPVRPENWTHGYNLYKFSFINEQPCKVKVNGGEPIFLQSRQGFQMDIHDSPIRSFIIIDAGIDYNWIGAY